MKIERLEEFYMSSLVRIFNSQDFKNDINEIESYIKSNYQKLHYHWGIKNKLKLAAERLIRFHVWKNYGNVKLYNTPLSSDIAFVLNDCVINIDCKTIDLNGNEGDNIYIQCEPNQANFENIPLNETPIPDTNLTFTGNKFTPILETFHNELPVLSFFVFINYFDDGNTFNIEGVEICCLPHNDIVKSEFNSDLIQNFKTYKYLNEMQAQKFGDYFLPTPSIKSHWKKFKVGNTDRYYDSKKVNPIDETPLVWGYQGKKYKVLLGGHTIRIKKESIKNRKDNRGNEWSGWEIIEL